MVRNNFKEDLDINIVLPWKSTIKNYTNILVSGLGGSAIGDILLKDYAVARAGVPVIVNRDYYIPAL